MHAPWSVVCNASTVSPTASSCVVRMPLADKLVCSVAVVGGISSQLHRMLIRDDDTDLVMHGTCQQCGVIKVNVLEYYPASNDFVER